MNPPEAGAGWGSGWAQGFEVQLLSAGWFSSRAQRVVV